MKLVRTGMLWLFAVGAACSGVQRGSPVTQFWCLQTSNGEDNIGQCFRTRSECESMRDRFVVGGGTVDKPCETQEEAYCFLVDDRYERCWDSESECTEQRADFVAQNADNEFGACLLRVGGQ